MKNVLAVDCCIRGAESRTKRIFDAFVDGLGENCRIDYLKLDEENLSAMSGAFFEQRQRLLEEGRLDHPRFRYARQFAQADEIVIAAPFWDLSFPALLKVYIEQLCVEGITFRSGHGGLKGICAAKDLIFITTRGGIFEGGPLEMGSRYLDAMHTFFGIENYFCIAADGIDMSAVDTEAAISKAIAEASALAERISEE